MQINIIVPTAPYHLDIAQRALESASAQTIACGVVQVIDHERRGAGWARNTGAKDNPCDFIVFLDSDDWIEPVFVERCLERYQRGHYVYTDLWMGERVWETPDCDAWLAREDGTNSFHSPCCLLPYGAWQAVGGFDERLPALEDGEFFWRLRSFGFCGLRVPQPLVHYGSGGQRSSSMSEEALNTLQHQVYNRYRGNFAMCASCNESSPSEMVIENARQEGDVRLEWIGGLAESNMHYPHPVDGSPVYIKPTLQGTRLWGRREWALRYPHLFRVVVDPNEVTPDVVSVLNLARRS
jgi:glycosyltransferase involved in cell wall biosynthesis